MLLRIKLSLICFKLQRSGTEINLHTSRILFWKDSSKKCQLCTKVRAPSRLVSQVWGKYKDEVPDMSGSNQSVETSCKNKLKLKELKDFCFKSKEKLATEKWMYETAIPKFWNFSGGNIISDYEFLFPILNAFTDGMEDYYARCYKANDANGLQKPFAWLQFHFIIRDCISSKLAHYRVWLKGTQITITR